MQDDSALDMVEKTGMAVERVILRRLHEGRIDGYTLEMSREIARAAIGAMREPLWDALKLRACAKPEDAVRIVMLAKSDFDAALLPTGRGG